MVNFKLQQKIGYLLSGVLRRKVLKSYTMSLSAINLTVEYDPFRIEDDYLNINHNYKSRTFGINSQYILEWSHIKGAEFIKLKRLLNILINKDKRNMFGIGKYWNVRMYFNQTTTGLSADHFPYLEDAVLKNESDITAKLLANKAIDYYEDLKLVLVDHISQKLIYVPEHSTSNVFEVIE